MRRAGGRSRALGVRRLRAVALQIALASLLAGAAHADPPALTLDWQAPDGCPTAARVLDETHRILAGSAVRIDPPIHATARVRQDGARWHLELETRRGSSTGTRALEGESCVALGEALIVILVLMIDPALVPATPPQLEPVGPPPAVAPPPPVEKPPPAPPATVVPPLSPPAPGCRWGAPAVGLAALGDVGALPGPAAGGEASFALRRCRLGAAVAARALAPRTGDIDGDPDARGALWLAAGGAVVALHGPRGLSVRGGLEAGMVAGRGLGVDNPARARTLWLAATAGASALLPLTGRLGARVALDLVVPLNRPRFVIDDVGAVHRASAVTGRIALGLELSLD